MFSTVAAPINIPTHSVYGFPFLRILTFLISCLGNSHASRGEVIFHYSFPDGDAEHVPVQAHVPVAICIPSLEKCLLTSFAYFLILVFGFSLSGCRSPLYILDINSLSERRFANYLLFCRLPFRSIDP